MTRTAHGHGLATIAADGTVLATRSPSPALGEPEAGHSAPAELTGRSDDLRQVTIEVVFTQIDLDAAPADAKDAYLRLHLLSHRLVQPRTVNLDGIFGVLANVVWTSAGPCAVDGFESVRARLRAAGQHVSVYGVDKFPRMVDYVVPSGVRIADADRVRLGAHLAAGTTVMHEGFVNYNAGTLGVSMVEGRISAGVVVGDGSDIGGGASIMGTLSGGGKEVITIGERSLLDVLDAQNTRINVQILRETARFSVMFAEYRVLAASGTLLDFMGIRANSTAVADSRAAVNAKSWEDSEPRTLSPLTIPTLGN